MDYLSLHRDTFNALAGAYQERRLGYFAHQVSVLKPFIEALRVRCSDHVPRVLDVGCGVGTDSAIFLESGLRVEAIDLSEEMVRFARENAPDAQVRVGDFLTAEIDGSFDGISASAVIHLFPKADALAVLEKCRALLAPSGIAFFTTSVSVESKEGMEAKDAYASDCMRYRKHWTKEEFEDAIHAAGFCGCSWSYDDDPCVPRQWMNVIAER